MKKTVIAVLTASAVLITACGSNQQDEAQAICMDPNTNVRVDDDFCEEDEDDFNGSPWVYFLAGAAIPAVGAALLPNTYHRTIPNGYKANFADYPDKGGNFTGRNPNGYQNNSAPTTVKKSTKSSSSKPTLKKPSAPKVKSGSSFKVKIGK